MKTYKILLCCIIALFGSFGCSNDDDSPALTQVQSSALDELPFKDVILTEPADDNPLLCTITWSETLMFLDGAQQPTPAGPVSYTLETDMAGAGFTTKQTLAVTDALAANIFVKDMNKLLIDNFGAVPGVPIDMEFRVISNYGENVTAYYVSENKLLLTITPYQSTDKFQPVYIIGDLNGWNNTDTGYIMFRDDSDPSNLTYTYTGKFGGYFKFCPAESLGSYKMYCNAGDGKLSYEDRNDGSFYVEGTAYKTVTLNLADMTWTMEDYDISGAKNWDMINFIGQFCNWGENDSDPAMTQSEFDPHIWGLTIDLNNIDYGVKFRADHNWDNRWCPPVSTAVPYGKTDYNPTSHDNNISLTSTGRYYIRFNDITGHYVFLLQ